MDIWIAVGLPVMVVATGAICALWVTRSVDNGWDRIYETLSQDSTTILKLMEYYSDLLRKNCEERIQLSEERDRLRALLEVQWERLLQMKVAQATQDFTPVMGASIRRTIQAAKQQEDEAGPVRLADAEKMVDESFQTGAP